MKAIKFVKWLLTLAGIGFVIYLILAGYQYYFTGFNSYQIQKASGSETIPPKFLWDWFGLLVIPVALAIVVFLLNRSEEVVKREVAKFEKEADRKIAEHNAQADREQNIDRQREESLQNYFDKMTELLLQYNLKANHDEVVANIARVKTLATVRVLDGMRKGLVLKFLFDAGLILGDKPIIDLQFADFSKTDYPNAYIGNANLTRVDFQDAKLRGLEMNGAIVRGTNFENADLVDVKLHECSFEGTIFHNTQLNGTSIFQSSFINIKFRKCLLVNTIWENCIFQNTHFISADLFNSKMKKVVFQSQRFDDTNFSKSSFEDVNFNGSIFSNVDLRYSTGQKSSFQDTEIYKSKFSESDLSGMNISSSTLIETSLNLANLTDANFSNSRLENVSFDGANLTNTNFEGVVNPPSELST